MRPGGWAFQYRNAHYPDLDDTAVVVMAMDRAREARTGDYDEAIARGARMDRSGCRARNGGWGAFDADNAYRLPQQHPLRRSRRAARSADRRRHARAASACWRSSARRRLAADDAPRIDYLEREQEADGSWFGRWGVNYIYGTWSVLCALNAAGARPPTQPMHAQGGGLADRDPERRRRLGRGLRQLRARSHAATSPRPRPRRRPPGRCSG